MTATLKTDQSPQDSWLTHLLPLLTAAVAVGVLLLSPFWAYHWYRLPFLGLFLEPNLVVSQISGADWPARSAGVGWSDRLVQVDATPVARVQDIERLLQEKGYQPYQLFFEIRTGGSYQVEVTPRPVSPGELLTQFGAPYLVGALFLVCGLWAYWMSRQNRAARAFLMMTAAICMSTVSFLDMNTTHRFLLGWSLSLSIAAGAIAHLALVFPQAMPFVERFPPTRFSPWVIALIIAVPTIRDILFPPDPWAYIDSWRWGMIFLAVALLFLLLTLFVRLFRSNSAIVRQQSRIIVFGTAMAFGPILFLYLVPSSMGATPVFHAGLYMPPLIVFPLSVAYAIVRYRLLDVDRVLSSGVTYGLVTLIAVGAFYAVLALLSLALQVSLNPSNPLVLATYLFLLVVALNPLRNLLQNTIDRVFYRTRADYRRILASLSKDLIAAGNLRQTITLVKEALLQGLNPEKVIVFLYDDDHGIFLPYGETGAALPVGLPDDPLAGLLSNSDAPLWLPPGKSLLPGQENTSLPARTATQVFAPLRYEGRMIGFFALGAQRSGKPYSTDDLEFLGAVANQSALAVENARLFLNLERTLDETLEMKSLLGDIFASIASGVITTNLQHKITLFNPAAEKILQISATQALGNPVNEVLQSSFPDLVSIERVTQQERQPVIGRELNPSLPERGKLHLVLSCTPLFDGHKEVKGATIVLDDLTEQHRLKDERERIRQTFGRVVAPRVRDRLLSEPTSLSLDGARQTLTVLFADLHGFTPFSERTAPETLLKVLNTYLSIATEAVLSQEGTLDKFIGDAVMAFWNAPDQQPDHTLRAVRAALLIERDLKEHRDLLDPQFYLSFGIGIARGEAMVGNVGTPELFNYTAIGDTVNLAQRLQSIAPPGQILLSEAAYQAVAEHVIAHPLPALHVKGREQAVQCWALQGLLEYNQPGLSLAED